MLVIISNNRSNFNDELHQETVAKDRDRPVENRWIGMRISEPDIDLSELAESLGFEAQGPITTAGTLMEAMEKGLKRSEEHTSELQSLVKLACRLLPEKKKSFSLTHAKVDYAVPRRSTSLHSASHLTSILRPPFSSLLTAISFLPSPP